MFLIRAATTADWPVIWQMFQAVTMAGDVFAYDETTTEATARQLWFDSPARAFVAEQEDEIVGTYYVRPNQPGRGAHIANGGYIVAPTARGQGLATTMCLHSLATAGQLGFTAMQFNYVISTNTAAIRAWERCGFETIGRVPLGFRHRTEGYVDVLMMYRSIVADAASIG